MFSIELTDWLTGDARGMPAWRGLAIDRALNGGTTATFQIANDDPAASFADMPRTVVRVWEDGALRFHGRIREPMVAKAGVLEIAAGSPYTLLDRRVGGYEFVATDQGEIYRAIIAVQNNQGEAGLGDTGLQTPGPYPASVTRDRLYENGKSIQEIFAELAAVIDGPYFVETPMIDPSEPRDLCQLTLRWPDAGSDRPGARFEYGEGTLANLSGYTLTQTMPLNVVTVSGAEGVAVGEYEDKFSQDDWGAFHGWFAEPDVTEAATLDEKAQALLRSEPTTRVEIEVAPGGPAVGDPSPPRLFHDFDVGDTVYVSVRDEQTEAYDLPQTVTQARLSVSEDDDSERLELTLQTPGEAVP